MLDFEIWLVFCLNYFQHSNIKVENMTVFGKNWLKAAVFSLAASGIAAATQANAINSAEIEGVNNAAPQDKLNTFSVEIRGPGGKKVMRDGERPSSPVIPEERLNPNAKKGSGSSHVAEASRDIPMTGFFYQEFPALLDMSADGDTLTFRSGDTTWNLANRTKSDGVTVNQQIAAIFRKNLKCFNAGSLNIRAGCAVHLPTPEQAKHESKKLADQLAKNNGVAKSEYDYALKNCPNGVCSAKIADLPDNKKTDVSKNKQAQDAKIVLGGENQDSGVIYAKQNGEKLQGGQATEVNPVSSLKLTDADGHEVSGHQTLIVASQGAKHDEAPSLMLPDNGKSGAKSDERVASGSKLHFSEKTGMVQGIDAKGEIVSEVSHKFDTKFNDIDRRMIDQTSGLSNAQTEIAQLREELKRTNEEHARQQAELLAKLDSLVTEKENKETSEMGDESIPGWVYALAGFFAILIVIACVLMLKTNKIKTNDLEDEELADDELDAGSNVWSLMSTDPVAMSSDEAGNIDLNTIGAGQNFTQEQKTSDEGVIISDSGNVKMDLQPDGNSTQKADLGTESVSSDSVGNNTSEQIDLNAFSPSFQNNPSNLDLDESAFLDDEPAQTEPAASPVQAEAPESEPAGDINLNLNLNDEPQTEKSAADQPETKETASAVNSQPDENIGFDLSNADTMSNDDIDKLLNSSQTSEPLDVKADDDSAFGGDIDDLLNSVQSASESDSVPVVSSSDDAVMSADDIDSLIDGLSGNDDPKQPEFNPVDEKPDEAAEEEAERDLKKWKDQISMIQACLAIDDRAEAKKMIDEVIADPDAPADIVIEVNKLRKKIK